MSLSAGPPYHPVSNRREQHSRSSQTSYTLPLPDLSDVTDPSLESIPGVAFSSGESVCYSERGGSVLWSAASAFVVCCLESASPLSCVLFPTSTVAANVPGLFFLWGRGLTWGRCRVSGEIVLGVLSWGGGGTSVGPRRWAKAGAVLGLFSWDVGVMAGFSRVGGALSGAAAGLKSLGADASC